MSSSFRFGRLLGVTIGAVGLMGTTAFADPLNEKALAIDASNGWRYYPAVQYGEVVGLLAEQLDDGASYGAYSTLWHQRLADDTWATAGYKGPASEAALVLASGNPGLSFGKALLPGVVNESCNGVATTTFEQLESGLSVNDPLMLIANEFTPEEIELLVFLGAEGAAGVSGMFVSQNDLTGATMPINVFLTDVTGFAQHAIDVADPSSTPPSLLCFPRSVTTTTEVPAPGSTWGVAGPNLCGDCTYTRAASVYTTTCSMSITCVSTCVTTGPVAGTMTRTAKSSNGTCPASP